jgi:hypothetical protein
VYAYHVGIYGYVCLHIRYGYMSANSHVEAALVARAECSNKFDRRFNNRILVYRKSDTMGCALQIDRQKCYQIGAEQRPETRTRNERQLGTAFEVVTNPNMAKYSRHAGHQHCR